MFLSLFKAFFSLPNGLKTRLLQSYSCCSRTSQPTDEIEEKCFGVATRDEFSTKRKQQSTAGSRTANAPLYSRVDCTALVIRIRGTAEKHCCWGKILVKSLSIVAAVSEETGRNSSTFFERPAKRLARHLFPSPATRMTI